MRESTTAPNDAKIQAGATLYMEVGRDQPENMEEFLYCLRKCGWTPDEITALQSRVAGILLACVLMDHEKAVP